ncbi:hypothetical protein C4256_02290 [Clostridioides difficile]|nr:hypothetical protein [Clostridioides difficile]MDV9723469.1 hypothetical protein [Clostridioides difficile]HBH0413451.1 hypothetical protein [Clostridioides difficile]HBH0416395.1 hypothetical protein [Clostridioides difficile]
MDEKTLELLREIHESIKILNDKLDEFDYTQDKIKSNVEGLLECFSRIDFRIEDLENGQTSLYTKLDIVQNETAKSIK